MVQAEEIRIFVDQNPSITAAGRTMQTDFELVFSSLRYPYLVMKQTRLLIEYYYSDAGRECKIERHHLGGTDHEDGWLLRNKKRHPSSAATR